MTLRFYNGGPEAAEGRVYWLTTEGDMGCCVAMVAGVYGEIKGSYWGPRRFHQSRRVGNPAGFSCTALLPIEV